MGKVEFLPDRCVGCGMCCNIAPQNFTFGDDGRTVMISDKVTDEAIEASESCPVSAIVINKEDCGKDSCCSHDCDGNCNCNN